jgi:hypothetical protein
MYRPGNLKEYSDDPVNVKELFELMYNRRYQTNDADAKDGSVFLVTLKVYMPQQYWNAFNNSPPAFGNILFDAADAEVIGNVNADQIANLQMKCGTEKKFTCLLDMGN